MSRLMKLPKTLHGLDGPQALGNITNCQWCGEPLEGNDKIYERIGENSRKHYLVCGGCEIEAVDYIEEAPDAK